MQLHQLNVIRDFGFAKGYNDTLPPEQLPPGYLADAQNCFIRTQEIIKRSGYSRLGTDLALSKLCQALKGIRFASGTKELIGVFNGSIYKYTGSGSFTLISGGSGVLSTSVTQVWAVVANNNMYFFDGVSTPQKYNGTAISSVSAIPVGTGAVWFHNILCVWGISGTPNNMQLSDLGNPEQFGSGIATTIGINPNDGDYIVTCHEFNDALMIFKSQHTFSLSGFGTASLTVSNIADKIPFGTFSLKGVCATGNQLLYLSFRGDIPHIRSIKRGMYGVTVDGGIISQDIEGTMNGLNKSQLSLCAAMFDGRNARFAVCNGASTFNNRVLVYDTITSGWVHHDGMNVSEFASFLLGTTPMIFFGESQAFSRAYQLDTSTSDDGNAITFSITTRRYGENMPEMPKKWRYIYIAPKETGNYNLTVDYAIDGFTFNNLATLNLGGSGAIFDNIILDTSKLGSTDIHRKRFSFPNTNSYYMQLKMYETSSTSSVNLRDWELLYFPRHYRRA